jgi:hypothetical protein
MILPMPIASFHRWLHKSLLLAGMSLASGVASAATSPLALPIITFSPLTSTTLTLSDHDTAVVQYKVTNQSSKTHSFIMLPIPGVTLLAGSGDCVPFTLVFSASCVLDLKLVGSAMSGDIIGGPVVCEANSPTACYQPSSADQLHVTLVHDSTVAIDVEPSSLSMLVGSTATIIVSNTDTSLVAQNLQIDVPVGSSIGIASTTCSSTLPPGSSCSFDITGSVPETATTLTIMGDNTTAASTVVTVLADAIFADGFEGG